MQASSDILLGWQHVTGIDGVERDFYVRQFRDMKGGFEIETLDEATLAVLGQVCAWTLARAHARSGDPRDIALYLGARSPGVGSGDPQAGEPERTSTRRWRSSQWPTPTRTTVTTPRSRLPWSRGGCPRVTTCEDRPLSVVARPGLRRRDHDQRRPGSVRVSFCVTCPADAPLPARRALGSGTSAHSPPREGAQRADRCPP